MARYFNTSGPNNPKEHYTLNRADCIAQGIDLVSRSRYFTIWAPRQTGKSTYFRLLAKALKLTGYKVSYISMERFMNASPESIIKNMLLKINLDWNTHFEASDFNTLFDQIRTHHDSQCVWILDEIENFNPDYFNEFLHSVRELYHERENHCLKSVILVGVSNITGIIEDNASPFNIADNLPISYFTKEEVHELLTQYETETGQRFSLEVKDKMYQITAGQPGLVNGFAYKLVEDNVHQAEIGYDDYLKVEDWYLRIPIDKNFGNILNKAKKHRPFVERLLFTDDKVPFKIDRESTKVLYTNGLIKDDGEGYIAFWVPFYKKRLYEAFYPYTNGEKGEIQTEIYPPEYLTDDRKLHLEKLIRTYKTYVKRRGFKVFLEKQEDGSYNTLKESALMYSFETFITAIMEELKGKIYREADTGLGKSDMIINHSGEELLIETKVYRSYSRFEEGKAQLSYYCQSLGLHRGLYIVFKSTQARIPERVKESVEKIEEVEIRTVLIDYDTEKW